MNEQGKGEPKKTATGSGSDTVSAARMGGNAPPATGATGGGAGRPAASGTGTSTGASTATGAGSAQSSTLASHTSKPLGGGTGATVAVALLGVAMAWFGLRAVGKLY